jgi:hypothetical protein
MQSPASDIVELSRSRRGAPTPPPFAGVSLIGFGVASVCVCGGAEDEAGPDIAPPAAPPPR